MDQLVHNATAQAGWWVAHRLMALLVERGVLTHKDALQVLDEGMKACVAEGSLTNEAAALVMKQAKAAHK